MKLAGKQISPMYLWTIALLVVVAAVASYFSAQFPVSLSAAVVSAAILDAAIETIYLKRAFRIPVSGIISGFVIGSVAPLNAPMLTIILAAAIAILSKHLIRTRHGNVLNPAAFGLLVALPAFSVVDGWWVTASFNVLGFALMLTPILAVASYKASRLTASLSFITGIFLINLLASYGAADPQSALISLLGINFFLAFIMIAEPKTSPNGAWQQAAYGIGIAVLYFLLARYRIEYAALIALLLGNVGYALYRMAKK